LQINGRHFVGRFRFYITTETQAFFPTQGQELPEEPLYQAPARHHKFYYFVVFQKVTDFLQTGPPIAE